MGEFACRGARRAASLFRLASLFALFLLAGIGCSGSGAPAEDAEATHIRKAAALIPEFTETHKGIPPADIEELKNWAVNEGKAQAEDFSSTRDKEPYMIAVLGGGKRKKGSSLIVHEAKGVNGMLYMVESDQASEISPQGLGYMTGGPQMFKPKGGE